ncbi:MAG: hypothetical protein J6F30_05390 [Cellulosilyticum sp.]|nr:hypothetical protein [Cellulosilyticum sp.]
MGKKKINLLPESYISLQKKKHRQLMIFGMIVLESLWFIGKIVIQPKIDIKRASMLLDEISMQLANDCFKEVYEKGHLLEQECEEVDRWNNVYQQLEETEFISKQLLDSLFAVVPKGVFLKKLQIKKEDQMIILEGTAQEVIQIMNYCTIIEGIFGYGTVKETFEMNQDKINYTYFIEISVPQEEILEETNEEEEEESGSDHG